MEPQFAPARGAAARDVWERVLRPTARAMADRSSELSNDIVIEIRAAYPELFVEPGAFEENLRATEGNVLLLADVIEQGLDPYGIELPAPSLAFTRASVERGMPVTGALRSLRLGHAALLRRLLPLMRAQAGDADTFDVAVELVEAWTFAAIDAISVLGEQAHEAERARWARSSAARQAEIVQRLLDGEPVDAAAASRQLGYELQRTHLAIVAWADDQAEGGDVLRALEDAIAQAAAGIGATRPLVQVRGTHMAAGWVAVANGADPGAVGPADGVRLAVGEAALGPAGFRAGYDLAMLARRVAVMTRRPPGSVTAFRDVELLSLATADPAQAQSFARRALGPLFPTDDLTSRLASTVQVYLDEDSSHSRAAHRLGIHENTVRYRVRQAEELLGRPISARSLYLRVALHIADAVGGEAP